MNISINTQPEKETWEKAIRVLTKDYSGNLDFISWPEQDPAHPYYDTHDYLLFVFTDMKNNPLLAYKAHVQRKREGWLHVLNVRSGNFSNQGLFLDSTKADPHKLLLRLRKEIVRVIQRRYGTKSLIHISFYMAENKDYFHGWNHIHTFTPILDLTKDELSWLQDLKDSTRRKIKKSKKKGVTIEISTDDKFSSMWYNFRHYGTADGDEPLPSSKWHYLYCVAWKEGKAIGCSRFSQGPHGLFYRGGGYDRSYSKDSPTSLAFWELIKWAKRKGFRYIDLVGAGQQFSWRGRTIDRGRDEGRVRFKKSFGGHELCFVKYHKIAIGPFHFNAPFKWLDQMYRLKVK